MNKGILGRKVGMTQIFKEGVLIPVTVLDVSDNVVLQQKTMQKDGYTATQLGFETKRAKLANKPSKGHVAKAKTAPKRFIKELRFKEDSEMSGLEVGSEVKASVFSEGDYVDVTATSKGKGFQGAIKRHNQHTGPNTHGSRHHRRPGSVGAIKDNPKGKKMPGHMGCENVTIQNLKIVSVDLNNNVLLISGSIPGPKKGLVMVKSAIKK